jgi:hypothetical protein
MILLAAASRYKKAWSQLMLVHFAIRSNRQAFKERP